MVDQLRVVHKCHSKSVGNSMRNSADTRYPMSRAELQQNSLNIISHKFLSINAMQCNSPPMYSYCQALPISLYLSISNKLNISLSLRDRDTADTTITLPHHQTTKNFLSTWELTYTQVWYIIGIVSSSPSYFCTENIGLIGVKRCFLS